MSGNSMLFYLVLVGINFFSTSHSITKFINNNSINHFFDGLKSDISQSYSCYNQMIQSLMCIFVFYVRDHVL